MKLWKGSVALLATLAMTPMFAQNTTKISATNGPAFVLDQQEMPGKGSLTLGLWYSQADAVSVSLGIDQAKFLKTDEQLHFGFEASAYTQNIDISVTDPDFFETDYTRRVALSFYNIHPNLTQNGDYAFSGGEASIGLGRQITERTAISFGAGTGRIRMADDAALPAFIRTYIDQNDAENGSIFGYLNVSYDHTDDSSNPSKGLRLNFSNEIGSVAGATYLKSEGSISHFSSLFGGANLNLHGSIARATTLNDGSFPIFESYSAGGPSSLRGFAQSTLGPTSAIPNSTERAYTGGKLRILGGMEITAPVARRDDMHVLTFLDFGNVFGEVTDLNAADLRGSIGIGMRWDSPVGPLSINLAQPMNTQLGDQTEPVQFTLGASF